jgi:hypothetical protein
MSRVIKRARIEPGRLPAINAWCDQVTEAPEESKRMVLSNGSSHGLIGTIPAGGQAQPSSTVGANAESKKAQKIEKNKQISDTINSMIPIERPRCTAFVW